MIESANQLVTNTFCKDAHVATEGANLCSWISQQQESCRIMGDVMTKVCMSPEVFDIIIWQISSACCDGVTGFDG